MMTYKNAAISITIFTLTLLAGAFMVMPTIAHAQNLVVNFSPNPLFEQNNFLPEDAVIGVATVTNNSGATQTILTESINGLDSDGLGDHLNLTIVGSDSTSYFSNTLGNFLTTGEVNLGMLDNSESEIYTFTVSFINIDDNAYQGKSLGFDVCVGFEGGDTNCGDTVAGGEGDTEGGGPSGEGGISTGTGGGGGGGPVNLVPLEVFSEEVTETNVVTTTAVIEWDSNLLSTSRVIYGEESKGPYSLSLVVLPNFGYPSSTVEDLTKVTHHVVTLIGLEVGTTYVYRVVSRASPPTVGFQQTFALVEEGDGSSVPDAPVGGDTPPSGGTGGSPTGETGGTGGEAPADFPEVQGAEESSTEASLADGTQAAALGFLTLPDDFSGWVKCFGLFLLFVVLIYIAWIIWRDRNKSNYTKDELSKRGRLFFFVGSLLSILIAYLLGWDCTIVPLVILAIISLVLYLLDLFTNRDR